MPPKKKAEGAPPHTLNVTLYEELADIQGDAERLGMKLAQVIRAIVRKHYGYPSPLGGRK